MKTNRSRKDDLVEEFQESYEDALVEVKRAAETTATDGWQQMYCAFMKANKDARESAADSLDALSAALRAKPIDGESMKALKGTVKDADDLCEQAAFFDARPADVRSDIGGAKGDLERQRRVYSAGLRF